MSSRLRRPALPLDIVHAVLALLKLPQDLHTLNACSQVCDDWLPVARKYLFAHLTTRSRVDDTDNPPEDWEVFHDHFFKPTHSNPAVVTHLVVVGSLTQNLDFNRLAPMLGSFPKLKHLCIQSWSIMGLEKPLQPILPSLSLEVLELRDLMCYTGSTEAGHGDIAPQRLLNLLYHVPHAEKVVFSNVPVVYNVHPNAAPHLTHLDIPTGFAPSSVHLSSGRLDNHFKMHLLQHLRSTPHTLRSLHVAFDEFTNVLPPIALLIKTARSLEVLELDFSGLDKWAAHEYSLHNLLASDAAACHLSPVFQSNTSLRTFMLIVPRAPSKYWAVCLRVLSELPAKVRCVELHVDFDSAMDLPLKKLGRRLAAVEVAKIVLKGCPLGSAEEEKRVAWSEYLHSGLSILANEGSLQVQFVNSVM